MFGPAGPTSQFIEWSCSWIRAAQFSRSGQPKPMGVGRVVAAKMYARLWTFPHLNWPEQTNGKRRSLITCLGICLEKHFGIPNPWTLFFITLMQFKSFLNTSLRVDRSRLVLFASSLSGKVVSTLTALAFSFTASKK